MDVYILDLLIVGILLLMVTLGSGWIQRLPLSYALIYLIVGVLLGPYGTNLVQVRPNAEFLERLTEFVVIVSVFSCGLKMNRALNLWAWGMTIRLIGLLMPISIFAIAAVAHFALKMEWGTAILLGGILAPTDPVLASEVQLSDLDDQDELRFSLTSEGGLNDALAFPFVYFGIHSLKDNNWQNWFVSWVAVDLIWAIAAGIVMGILVPRFIVWVDKKLQKKRAVDELMEDFVALAIILVTYATTEVVNGYGFLAVFVAGIVTHRSYHNPEKHHSQLEFTERIEKLMEVGTILILGSILRVPSISQYAGQAMIIIVTLLLIIRPVGTYLSTFGSGARMTTRSLIGWFGIRGVGSIYYLCYAFGEGLKDQLGEQIAWITYITIVISVVVHGISSTPLMNWYEQRNAARRRAIQQIDQSPESLSGKP